jgi:NADH-quinone oxidoreductase subunit N
MYAGVENAIPKYLINWTAVARRNFTLALSFALFLFSVAGIPPLAGFYSKLCILLSLLGKGHCFLAVVVIVFSSIACFYYIRLVKIFFFTVGGNNNFWSGFGTRNLELFIGSGLSITWLFLTRPLVLNTMATLAALTVM